MIHNPKAVDAMAAEMFESGMSPKLNKALAKRTLNNLAHLGFVLMPIEPTEEMIEASAISICDLPPISCAGTYERADKTYQDLCKVYAEAALYAARQSYHNIK